VSGVGSWSRNAAVAMRLAGGRPDLWLPGSLGALTLLAWLPLMIAVVAVPRASDVAFWGAALLSSGAFPWNVFLIAVSAACALLLGCLVAALAEAALLRMAGLGTAHRSLARDTEAAFTVLVVAVLPTAAAVAALAIGIAAVAPAEFGAPDLGGPLIVRIAVHLAPLIVVLVALLLVGQAFGAGALRWAIGPDALPAGAALRAGLADLLRHPLRRVGLALTSTLGDLVTLLLAVAVLHVLWAPIAVLVAEGHLVSPRALLLLVGFVGVWFAIVLAFGALHVWVSTWWSLERATAIGEARPAAQETNP
jgi:hypothetical protein